MTRYDAEALRDSSRFLWNSEIWRVTIRVHHRFEAGYEPSDMDSLRLDCRQLLPKPEGRTQYRHTGSLWVDVNYCGLRLERTGKIMVACGDSSERVLEQFKQLVGKTLVHIDVSSPVGDGDFALEDGLMLRCFPASHCANDSWGVSPASNDQSGG